LADCVLCSHGLLEGPEELDGSIPFGSYIIVKSGCFKKSRSSRRTFHAPTTIIHSILAFVCVLVFMDGFHRSSIAEYQSLRSR
jgi:hypothetical protein